jgi:lipoprotein-releasing system permease protein
MRGSEKDFMKRLVDNSAHITVSDEYRAPREQPAELRWADGAIGISNVKPQTETRGIRGYRQKLEFIESLPGVRVAPVLVGSAAVVFAGRQEGITLSRRHSGNAQGRLHDRRQDRRGLARRACGQPQRHRRGQGLADKFNVGLGRTVGVSTPNSAVRPMKVVGVFRTGISNYDDTQTFVLLKRAQVMLDRPNRVNRFILQLDDAYDARAVSTRIERSIGYKSVSWQEASEDLVSVLMIRNIIMYSVVSAILVVASFGIYNTLSTIVMEKTRDIAIMKSMGFHARDVRVIFLLEGFIVGAIGSSLGLLIGVALMKVLSGIAIRVPGATEEIFLPVWWGAEQYLMAAAFALSSCLVAAYLPARKAGRVHPVDILRGAT